MIMKQEKRTEAETSMGKNSRKTIALLILAELGCMVVVGGGVYLLGLLLHTSADKLLANAVMAMAGIAVAGFQMRQAYLRDELDYNNGLYPFRFWACMCIGLVTSFVCTFLPFGAWPFLTVFVMLSLFSNMSTGILASSALLLIPLLINGASFNYFALYFISGCFAVSLFQDLQIDFKIGLSLSLSILCLMVCETANVVLLANDRPNLEMFLIPIANIIISSILLVGCLKQFSTKVIYQFRVNYLEVNDTENDVLVQFKEESRDEYFISIHAAYFCDRIAQKIGMDTNMIKCAAYYHRFGDKLKHVMKAKRFPPKVREILLEYQSKKPPKNKETAILFCADTIVSIITKALREGGDKPVDYAALVDSVFKKLDGSGFFWQCNLTTQEYRIMYMIFREEKLYYDFLR